MIERGYSEKNEKYSVIYPNGNQSQIFIHTLIATGGKRKSILDIGCGYGKYTQMLASKYGEVVGLDLSGNSIDYALKHYSADNIKYIVADSSKLPFADSAFDVVFSRLSPHNLEEMKRVLKPGGLALCMRVGETDALELRGAFGQRQMVTKMQGYVRRGERHSQHIVDEWKKNGFTKLQCKEYEYEMIFRSTDDLAKYLSRIPIVPEFNEHNPAHMKKLSGYVERTAATNQGRVILPRHRYIIEGYKPA